MSDILFPDKKTGFIALEYNDVQFITPDMEEVDTDNIDTYLKVPHIIRDTKKPTYKCAHYYFNQTKRFG